MEVAELMHYGILGMKWGVRRYQNKDGSLTKADQERYKDEDLKKDTSNSKWGIEKERLSFQTKSGDSISLSEQPPSLLATFLAKYSKKAAAEIEKTAIYDIKNPEGKKVGDITLYKESLDSINVVWLTTKDSVRGRGYGTAVMKAAIQIAKDTGAKSLTLEVPGSSPDAKHIYEKLGFKEVASPNKDVDDVWGGLTNMKLDLDDVHHSLSHSDSLIGIPKEFAKKYAEFLASEIDSLRYAKKAAITGVGALGTAAIGSVMTKALADKGHDVAAAYIYTNARTMFSNLVGATITFAGASAVHTSFGITNGQLSGYLKEERRIGDH